MRWLIFGTAAVLWVGGMACMVSDAHAQDEDLQQQMWQLKQDQLWLEHDVQVQQLRHQQDRMFYRIHYGNTLSAEDRKKLDKIILEHKLREQKKAEQ